MTEGGEHVCAVCLIRASPVAANHLFITLSFCILTRRDPDTHTYSMQVRGHCISK